MGRISIQRAIVVTIINAISVVIIITGITKGIATNQEFIGIDLFTVNNT